MIDKNQFAKLIMILAENFGGEPSEALIETWWRMIQKNGISADQFRDAAESLIMNRKYKTMPTFAEIIESINGTVEDKAQLEASKVLNAVRVIGFYGHPKFDDPVTASLMSTRWRWQSFCQTLEESKVQFWVKEFVAAYLAASKQPEQHQQIGYGGFGRDVRQLTNGIGN